MIVIGYHMAHGVLTDSRGNLFPVLNLWNILDELLEPYKQDGQQTWKVAFDIDALVIPILKLLPLNLLTELAEKEAVELPDRRIRLWYPRQDGIGQCLSITDKTNHNEQTIWSLGSFMPDGIEPPKDALETEAYARKIMDIFAKQLKYTPVEGHFFSPVNVVRPYLQGMNLPKVTELPSKVANYASKCMSPPWVEAHQLGLFDVTDVDLTNAYAGVLASLPDWRLGDWYESKDYERTAAFGYCVCNVNLNKAVHPILSDTDPISASLVGPQSEKYLTKGQIAFIRKFELGEVDILDGVWWQAKQLHRPLATVIDRLTRQREETREGDRKLGRFEAKKVLVGMWGYTARWDWERGKKPDEFYNPVWAAEITTRIPMRVAAFLYGHDLLEHLVHVAVDGFTVDCDVTLTEDEESRGWKIAETGPNLCLSSHHSWLGQRRPEGVDINEVLKMIRAKPRNSLWTRKYMRRATLGDCMQRDDLSLLGTEIDCQNTIYLKQQHNRHFPRQPKTGNDLLTKHYRSKPLEV